MQGSVGETLIGLGAGLGAGAIVGGAAGYGVAALTAACLPCGVAVGVAALAYAGYGLYQDSRNDFAGVSSFGNSVGNVFAGTATAGEAFGVGFAGGSLAGGVGGSGARVVTGSTLKAGRSVGVPNAGGGGNGFLGSRRFQMKSHPSQPLQNTPVTINGRNFSGHALDQMRNRGIMPSVVENAIKKGTSFPTRAGTKGFFDPVNKVRVITNAENGRVVTVIPGALR